MSELLIASNPMELVDCQHALITDIESKREAALIEARDAKASLDQAIAVRLDVSAMRRVHLRATSRVTYLTKVEEALRAGYLMMPDMPGTTFAVRTDRERPADKQWRSWVRDEATRALPGGEGKYVSPIPETCERRVEDGKYHDGSVRHATQLKSIALRDPDGLNRQFLRPEVMSRTTFAMAKKLFDELATVSNQTTGRKNRDPIVVGRIVDLANGTVSAFLVAWFVDVRTL